MQSALRGPAHQSAVRMRNYFPINQPAMRAPATARAPRVCSLVPFILYSHDVVRNPEAQSLHTAQVFTIIISE